MSTGRNVVANIAGRVWGSLMSFVFVPFYIRFMGVEAYGLVGFFTSLMAVFFILDMGLSTTINRELARLSAEEKWLPDARTLVRTLEGVYWLLGIVVAAIIVAAAPWIAVHWLKVGTLDIGQTTDSIRLMGFTAALRWPVALYAGALMGMRCHVLYNCVTALYGLLQGAGAVLALWLIGSDVRVFFGWQLAASALQIGLLYACTWHRLRLPGHLARFAKHSVRAILKFSAGVTGITVLSVILMQLDKFVLSKLLPLEQFGFYTLATTLAATLTTASTAIYGAIFPALAHLAASDRRAEISTLYHESCQFLSVVIVPASMALCLFSPELLQVYLRDSAIVTNVHLLLSLFAIGNAMLSIMMLPYALQLAFGWTSLSIYKNVIAVIVFVPLMLVLVNRFGPIGAAMAWLTLTTSYFVLEITIMHRRLLPGEQWAWYLQDVGVPVLVSVVLIGSARMLAGEGTSLAAALTLCIVSAALSLVVSALAVPNLRSKLLPPLLQRLRAARSV